MRAGLLLADLLATLLAVVRALSAPLRRFTLSRSSGVPKCRPPPS
jgi:hypothetical protein